MIVALPGFFSYPFFYMWHLFCHHMFLISPSFGASSKLCFVIVAFSGYFTHILGIKYFPSPKLVRTELSLNKKLIKESGMFLEPTQKILKNILKRLEFYLYQFEGNSAGDKNEICHKQKIL